MDGAVDPSIESAPPSAAEMTQVGASPPPGAERPKHRAPRTTRVRRRVTTAGVPGTDPAPAGEPPRHVAGENDEQLRRDVPPHWA